MVPKRIHQTQFDLTCFRMIPSRYPTIDIFEHVASQDEFDDLFEIESRTNDRLVNSVGDIRLVPESERVFGQGSSFIMAPFTHPPEPGQGGRFNKHFGSYYAARTLSTAILETQYHQARFLRDASSPPIRIQMREIRARLQGKLHTITNKRTKLTEIYHSTDYRCGQNLGNTLKQKGSNGLAYDSVRDQQGTCFAVFKPPVLSRCRQGKHFEYHFDGESIKTVMEISLHSESVK